MNLIRFRKNSMQMSYRIDTFRIIHSLLRNNSRFWAESSVRYVDLYTIIFLDDRQMSFQVSIQF